MSIVAWLSTLMVVGSVCFMCKSATWKCTSLAQCWNLESRLTANIISGLVVVSEVTRDLKCYSGVLYPVQICPAREQQAWKMNMLIMTGSPKLGNLSVNDQMRALKSRINIPAENSS
ncbi:uncharacterized protein LOC141697427 [Apium graveolens]|uniref:uncharacterized protein LOC141697427 n=1 Tax=Apium graveolens TaxID=4045 RepID=UPI003D78D405